MFNRHFRNRFNGFDFKITKIGAVAARFSEIKPESARLILAGYIRWPALPYSYDGKFTYVIPKAPIRDLITMVAILEARDNILRKLKDADYLLSEGTPDFIQEHLKANNKEVNLVNIWDLVQCELLVALFCFYALIKIIKRRRIAEQWAIET